MFSPSREQARRFFFDTWRKYRTGNALAGLETVALQVMLLHPEYESMLDTPDRTADLDFAPEMGRANPFLHLSLHLAVEEQLSIDQPPGIGAVFEALLARKGDRHETLHAALECLGETLWRAQRNGLAPDAQSYLECLRRDSGTVAPRGP